MYQYKKPFQVVKGRIQDADGREVKLWGVNYYTPFHHNYYNMNELGVDHFAAIDRDIADFKKMKVEVVRMHLYDREISDMYGNVVDNIHLELLDYLIQRLDEEGIYIMMTPIAWWNSAENQVMMTKGYAYWCIGDSPAFGFSNFFPKHTLVWNPKALRCQERYLNQLFERKNRYSGKRWNEYDNMIAVEIINEPDYPYPYVIDRIAANQKTLRKNPIGREEVKLLKLYQDYLTEHSELDDCTETKDQFCADLVLQYINRMFQIVEKFFGDTVLKVHIHYGSENPHIHRTIQEGIHNCISYTVYAPCYFDSGHNDAMNLLKEVRDVKDLYCNLEDIAKGAICYEFDTPSTLLGYPLAAMGYMMAAIGIQIAACFVYTPIDVAPYNPGWLVHYLNLYHTPARAAAFMAGGEIFRSTKAHAPLPESDEVWKGEYFAIKKENDFVLYHNDDVLLYSNSCEDYRPEKTPGKIVGRGSGCYVQNTGSGCYFLEKVSDDELQMAILPDTWFTSDPYRGKSFGFMANRYMDLNVVSVVSRLKETGPSVRVDYPDFQNAIIYYAQDNTWKPVAKTGETFIAKPGNYRILKKENSL